MGCRSLRGCRPETRFLTLKKRGKAGKRNPSFGEGSRPTQQLQQHAWAEKSAHKNQRLCPSLRHDFPDEAVLEEIKKGVSLRSQVFESGDSRPGLGLGLVVEPRFV